MIYVSEKEEKSLLHNFLICEFSLQSVSLYILYLKIDSHSSLEVKKWRARDEKFFSKTSLWRFILADFLRDIFSFLRLIIVVGSTSLSPTVALRTACPPTLELSLWKNVASEPQAEQSKKWRHRRWNVLTFFIWQKSLLRSTSLSRCAELEIYFNFHDFRDDKAEVC